MTAKQACDNPMQWLLACRGNPNERTPLPSPHQPGELSAAPTTAGSEKLSWLPVSIFFTENTTLSVVKDFTRVAPYTHIHKYTNTRGTTQILWANAMRKLKLFCEADYGRGEQGFAVRKKTLQ